MTAAKEKFLEDLYSQHQQFLRSYCRRKVGGDQYLYEIIEESIQDTFFQAYKSYNEIKHYNNIRSWLIRTCNNRLLPKVKKARSRQSGIAYSLDQPHTLTSAEAYAPIDLTDNHLDAQLLLDKLQNNLSLHETLVYQYHFIQGYSIIQTAEILNVSQESIKAAIVRIRKKLAKI